MSADVSDEEDVTRLFDEAEEAFDGVDVVAHAAGIMQLAPLAETDVERFDRIQRVNLRGTFLVAREAVRRIRDGGAILAFSSSVLGLALPTYAAYAASKGAVEAMVPVLAKELRGRDVSVNAIAPGPTATALFLDGKDDETVDRLASAPPLERLGTPVDAAEVVAFLAGPGHWINGQVLRVNGASSDTTTASMPLTRGGHRLVHIGMRSNRSSSTCCPMRTPRAEPWDRIR